MVREVAGVSLESAKGANSSFLVIVLLFLIVDAVDSALEIQVLAQALEVSFNRLRFVATHLVAHPVEVKLIVEVDATPEGYLEVTDVFSLVTIGWRET